MNSRLRLGPSSGALLAILLGLVIGGGGVVFTRTEILRMQYTLTDLHEREDRLRGEVEKLRVEVAALSAPDRIEERARALGLRYPLPGEVLTLETPPRRSRDRAQAPSVGRGQEIREGREIRRPELARLSPPGTRP